jgi:hypothetical protein
MNFFGPNFIATIFHRCHARFTGFAEKRDKIISKVRVGENCVVEVNDRSIQLVSKILIASDDWH